MIQQMAVKSDSSKVMVEKPKTFLEWMCLRPKSLFDTEDSSINDDLNERMDDVLVYI